MSSFVNNILFLPLFVGEGKFSMPCYSPKYMYAVRSDDGSADAFTFKHPDWKTDSRFIGSAIERWRSTGELISFDSRYHPVLLPCQQCFGCRRTKAAQYGARSVQELSISNVPACMLTLTHKDAPVSLDHKIWQDFAKRFRWHFKQPLRILMCGEYGEQFQRPHYHAIVFGEDFVHDRYIYKNTPSGKLYNSRSLDMLWPHGWSTINDVTLASAMYVGGYCYKKINTAGGEPDRLYYADGRRKEYVVSSHSPALGVPWIEHYHDVVFNRDGCLTMKSGVTMPIPRAYKEWCKIHRPDLHLKWTESVRERIAAGQFDIISDLEDVDASEYAVQYNSIVLGLETDYVSSKRDTSLLISEQKFARKSQL